ncbi:hypothetical protein SDC9_96692 [bioreactor metagenome]|uniref:Uncharacterized protein n=1 Tax=bioreactor metagenome TaxID=1076179 RepID=A0A645AB85_9ZZZZ
MSSYPTLGVSSRIRSATSVVGTRPSAMPARVSTSRDWPTRSCWSASTADRCSTSSRSVPVVTSTRPSSRASFTVASSPVSAASVTPITCGTSLSSTCVPTRSADISTDGETCTRSRRWPIATSASCSPATPVTRPKDDGGRRSSSSLPFSATSWSRVWASTSVSRWFWSAAPRASVRSCATRRSAEPFSWDSRRDCSVSVRTSSRRR